MSKSIEVIILDFDGVVIESNDIKTRAFEKVFDKFPQYKDVMMQFHYENISISRVEKFDYLATLIGRGADLKLKAEITNNYSQYVLEDILTAPLVKGAERFLKMAKGQLPLYLASVTPANELNHILEKRGLLHWFDGVYGCPPWTKANAICDIVARNAIFPKNSLLIGDSSGDQRAAFETGIQFIARDSGLKFDEIPPLLFSDLNEIADYVGRFLK
jgi:phosphoglycolate phosphatase-like HAD superfamily hydrolase